MSDARDLDATLAGSLVIIRHGERPADVPEPVDPADVGTPLGDLAGPEGAPAFEPLRIGRPPRRSDYRR